MAFLSGFVKSGLSFLGKDSASFPYSIGAKVDWFDDQTIWSLHHGTKKEDGSRVSIFTFDCNKNRERIQLARNAFKRMRTMRHPDLLRYLDGVETEQAIMMVTDPIEPLSNQLNQDPDDKLLLWGLYKVANAIKFINNDCDMIHGNIRPSSIFINQAGEWKLGGFELFGSMKDESPIILTFGGLVADAPRYAPPEVKKGGWTVIKDLPTAAVDSYQLGCLIYEVYNRRFDTPEQLISQRGRIPSDMYEIYRALLRPSANSRADASDFLDTGLGPRGFFASDFVQINLFLENISIKDQKEREGFFRQLDNVIDTFPNEFSKYKILPELVKAFEFGSGGAKSLSAILKIGQHLPDDEYQSIIVAPVIRMFASPDRAIRVSLLENLPKFVDHIPNKVATNQVFPHVATGFTDTMPVIREQTIKAIMHLMPKLSERVINYDLLKYLAKLQMDEEPGIRTNTTICLGKIAKYMTEATRKKVLVPAFTRGLRDGFHHARVAALMALGATADFYDATECANRIVPCISVVLLDKEKPVRQQAAKAMQAFLARIEEYADKMPDTAIEAPPPEANASSPDATGGGGGNQTNASMTGILGEATKGLAGWAVSSINARFGTPTGEITNLADSAESRTPSIASSTVSPRTQEPSLLTRVQETILQDDNQEANGWDDDNEDLIGFEQKDSWEPLEAQKVDPEPISAFLTSPKATPRVASFGAAEPTSLPTHKAPSSMQLTSKKTASFAPSSFGNPVRTASMESRDKSSSESPSTKDDTASQPTVLSKDEKRAEMERRREERRQRMNELREKKKSGLGAKKI